MYENLSEESRIPLRDDIYRDTEGSMTDDGIVAQLRKVRDDALEAMATHDGMMERLRFKRMPLVEAYNRAQYNLDIVESSDNGTSTIVSALVTSDEKEILETVFWSRHNKLVSYIEDDSYVSREHWKSELEKLSDLAAKFGVKLVRY